ncbi:MAG: hypothetical protein J1F01_06735 [Oscillospiraceae bacterium]|nr:hypothetical protein [Oscillospiraceae bacterium]
MKKIQIIISVICYVVFIALWCIIGIAGWFFITFGNDIIPGFVIPIMIVTAIVVVAYPLYSKLKYSKRAYVSILLTLAFCVTVATTYFVFEKYYSVFTYQKWHEDREHRYMMVNSLENKYKIDGMTGEEVIEILGEPENIAPGYNAANIPSQYMYEYYAGYKDNFRIDPMIYRIIFENGIAVRMECIES